MSILSLISSRNFIALNKDLIKIFGLEEAIMIGELCSEADYWEKEEKLIDGYFFSTVENVQQNTTLSEHKQRKAINNLKNKNIIDIQIKGLPAKRYIKINKEALIKLLFASDNIQKNLRTSSLNFKELDAEKLRRNNNIYNNNKKEEEKNKLIEFYNNNIGTITPYIAENIDTYLEDGLTKELIQISMKEAVNNNVRKWKYVKAILDDCLNNNVYTVEQYIAKQKEYKENSKNTKISKMQKQEVIYNTDFSEYDKYMKRSDESG